MAAGTNRSGRKPAWLQRLGNCVCCTAPAVQSFDAPAGAAAKPAVHFAPSARQIPVTNAPEQPEQPDALAPAAVAGPVTDAQPAPLELRNVQIVDRRRTLTSECEFVSTFEYLPDGTEVSIASVSTTSAKSAQQAAPPAGAEPPPPPHAAASIVEQPEQPIQADINPPPAVAPIIPRRVTPAVGAPPVQLRFLPPGTQLVPFPRDMGMSGYWEKVAERTNFEPFDNLMNVGWFTKRAHASIAGIHVTETDKTFGISMTTWVGGIPVPYSEHFNKDGSETSWMLRRDIRAGRTHGRLFYTSDNKIVAVTTTAGMLPNYYLEEYIWQEESGAIVVQEHCINSMNGKTAIQYIVGRPPHK